MEKTKLLFLKAVFFFVVGVILSSLFVWSFVQGFLIHQKDPYYAFYFYFVSFLAGIAALALYFQAKTMFYYTKMSD
ncbi:MAG: hypothetical protein N3D73_01910 [Candidatus Diapherotrites archaeon]|nr:hypothetical protein [Candidatus Diapherotrites archaeon]